MEPPGLPQKTTPRKPKKQEIDHNLRELKGFAVELKPTPPPPEPPGRRVGNSRDIANTDIVPEDDGTPITVGTAFPTLATKQPTLDQYENRMAAYA